MNASEPHARTRIIQDVIRISKQERTQVTTPAPKPEKKRSGSRMRKIGGGVVLLATLGATSLIAQADFTALYPASCEGGWEQSSQAQVAELKDNQDPAAFTNANSAVWKREGNTAITCKGFEDLAAGSRVLRLKLGLSWMFKTSAIEQPAEIRDAPQGEPEQATPSGADEGSEAPVITPEPSADIAPSSHPEEPAVPVEEPVVAEPPVEKQEPTPTQTPPEEPAPVSTPEGPQSFWSHFIAPAYAEDGIPQVTATLAFNGLKDFIAIEYSTDGAVWTPVTNADLEIPITKESDIKTMQVRVRTLRTDADLPTIYLDGIWLEAKYRAGDIQADDEAPAETSSLGDAIVDAISEIPQTIIDTIAPEPEMVTIEKTEAPEAPVVVPEPVVVFTFEKTSNQGMLAQIKSIVSNTKETDDAVQIEPGAHAISLTWPCSDAYGTVLLFEHPDDVTRDPTKAIVNRANACVNGVVSHTIREADLPRVLQSGTYTLFAADQDAVGVWKLTGKVYPIAIQRTIELR